jgi:hypothetical protein
VFIYKLLRLIVSSNLPSKVIFGKSQISFKGYPFRDSIAYQKGIIHVADIENVDITSFPPQIKVNNELIFISAQHKAQLEKFSIENNIKLVRRVNLWALILEPFLYIEFDEKHDERTYSILKKYNVEKELVDALRNRIRKPMIVFDSVYWDWHSLDSYDVLIAMRPTLTKKEFTKFYAEVMEIALIPDKYRAQP